MFKRDKNKSLYRRFLRNQDGSNAVEFALVVPVFLALMFSISELGWVYFTDNLNAVTANDAARLIRTGQIQSISTESDPDAQRRVIFNEVCKTARIYGACSDVITVEVVTYPTFAALAADNSDIVCSNSTQEAQDSIRFDPGTDDSIVRVRICILYDSFNPAVGLSLQQTHGGRNRIVMQELFRNEPFSRNVRTGGSSTSGSGGSGTST